MYDTTNPLVRVSGAGRFWMIMLLAGMVAPAWAQPAPEPVVDELSPPTPVEPADAVGFPNLPEITLAAPPPEFADDDAYQRSIAARADALAEQAATLDDPMARAEQWLASANLSLSFGVEPYCTRAFLNLPAKTAPADTETPSANLARAIERIDQALTVLQESELTPARETDEATQAGEPDAVRPQSELATRRASLRLRASALRAFANAQAVFLAQRQTGAVEPAGARDAASDLAPVLEDEDRRVAYAALFWQSVLRSSEPDPEAVLSRLEYVSAEPGRGMEPYAFLGRLLRCRVLADREPKPVALALLLQLEERCFDWFDDPPRREAALRTVALARLQVLRAWYEALDPTSAPEERVWCADRARAIIRESFGDGADSVIRLLPAIPVIVAATDAVSMPQEPVGPK